MSGRVLQVHEHTWTPADRAELQIRSLPVDVPRDVEALRIDLDVAADVGSVIDLGAQSPRGYVGWSGGARRQIVISAEWSTPGYLPTRGYAGTWQVLLGLHRVPADGARTTVTVRESNAGEVARLRALEPADPPVPLRPPRRTLPSSSGLTWLAADFHTHTVHSDGSLSVGGLAALAVSRGLDVLAITDHNTTSHHAELPAAATRYGIQLVPGQEITRDTGHANAFGDIGFVDFRTPPATWAAEVASRGGVFSINHPLAGDCAWLVDGLVAGSRDASGTGSGDGPARPLAEVWHSSWEIDRTWGAPLAWWSARP
ncbi:MAG: CehA/McbA family metallohydrolase [Actinomycetales bacterium]|uniref:CehA/McbA family metallohydrolase n=1 Tax=Candidatus Phosphoribacter hodrii TaxID=2953743 RepID=A0A935IJL2_9MICO|nr:CehA/McbA family metallohydrolase [Candidatus Phosphoribacter hodrii]